MAPAEKAEGGKNNQEQQHGKSIWLQLIRIVMLFSVLSIMGFSYQSTQKIFHSKDFMADNKIDLPLSSSLLPKPTISIATTKPTVSIHSHQNDKSIKPQKLPPPPENHYKVDDSFTVIQGVQLGGKRGGTNATTTTLKQPTSWGPLKHDWSYHEPLSYWARLIHAHQTNCSLSSVETLYLDNSFGFGSHLALWSQGFCNAASIGIQTTAPARFQTKARPIWLWLDQTLCNTSVALVQSPLLCYFPMVEHVCPQDSFASLSQTTTETMPIVNVSDPRDKRTIQCQLNSKKKKDNEDVVREFRAASTEYIFQSVSPIVIQEAHRQVGLLFGPEGAPDNLICVHIRWGDKFWEMDLVPIQDYVDAVRNMLQDIYGPDYNTTSNDNSSPVHIYLATEDPRAVDEFQNATASFDWNVYFDRTIKELSLFRPEKGNRASWMTKNTKGRAGLVGLGSLLVAMEAKYFILTTRSNWSRLMDQLRTNVINPRCNNCTKMIDLRPGVW